MVASKKPTPDTPKARTRLNKLPIGNQQLLSISSRRKSPKIRLFGKFTLEFPSYGKIRTI
jgi:hypothetical protein